MTHETRNFSDGSLFVHFESFWQKELILLTKDDFFLLYNALYPKNCFEYQEASGKSD